MNKKSLQALVLGCGEGSKVLRWAETKKFGSIDAYDLSDNLIRYAIDRAEKKGYGDVIHYHVGDVSALKVPDNSYDVIICEASLHHFSSLATFLPGINASLKSDGKFIVNEFVGPTRFQWTDRQLEIVNALLAIFPSRYKTEWNRRTQKLAVIRPSKLGMVLYDPSEAVESSKILPLLHTNFTVDEQKGYGGTILHLLLDGIAHHFITPDAEAERLLQMSFAIEDLMLESGEIHHDFIFAVCGKKMAA
jgi:SAM-dependent methyltransferase